MKNTITASLFTLFGVLNLSQAHDDFFRTKARMDVSWLSLSGTEPLDVNELFLLEETMSSFLHEQLSHLINDDKLALSTSIQVKDQQVGLNAEQKLKYTVEALVVFHYLGHTALNDFAFLLAKASMDGLQNILQKDIEKIDPDVDSFLVAFSFLDDDTQLLYEIPDNTIYGQSEANRGLVVACSFLVAVLIFVSCVLLYVSGGARCLSDMGGSCNSCYTWIIDSYAGAYSSFGAKEVKKSNTDKTDDTPDHVLGADAAEDEGVENLPPGFSPKGRVYSYQDEESEYGSEIMSPMSQGTDMSSRMFPLGIMSARKLNIGASSHSRPPSSHIPKYSFHQEHLS